MRLDRIVAEVSEASVIGDASAAEVTHITHDSRAVRDGSLFACVSGASTDGHAFASVAVKSGAVALLVERQLEGIDVPQVLVPSVRESMGPLAAIAYGRPSQTLDVVGVTGTNGKTTTTYLLKAIFDGCGRPAGVVGTMSGQRTTPEAPDLQAVLAEMVDEGKRAAAIEVSSPALVQHRVAGIWFAAAIFTNLGRDHLDVHGTRAAYFEAKASLFRPELAAVGVVSSDDDHGRILLERRPIPMESFSMADATDLDLSPFSSSFHWSGHAVELGMGGDFNVANALAAATAARAVGLDPADIAAALSNAEVVAGHFEPIDAGQEYAVLVDYAHTPEALDSALAAARRGGDPQGRLIVVFGCGGDRDPSKRPQMGEAASRWADIAVLTSDNPRTEDAEAILDQVEAGMTGPAEVIREPDRFAAIATALGQARPGDVVVIAGKGHETGQEVGDQVLPFDDRQVARLLLKGPR